jgi:hypothetical protein
VGGVRRGCQRDNTDLSTQVSRVCLSADLFQICRRRGVDGCEMGSSDEAKTQLCVVSVFLGREEAMKRRNLGAVLRQGGLADSCTAKRG